MKWRRRRHKQKARLLPLSFSTEGSSHSKRISTDAILVLTSFPNSFMDVVASLMHDRLPKCYIGCTRVQRLKFILPTIVPRNLRPQNLILGALSSFSWKFPPSKITRYTVNYAGICCASEIMAHTKTNAYIFWWPQHKIACCRNAVLLLGFIIAGGGWW